MKQQTSSKFVIKHFDDYHEIEDCYTNWSVCELGCFRPKTGYDYNRYFALYWVGRKPSKIRINNSLKRKLDCSYEPFREFDIQYPE